LALVPFSEAKPKIAEALASDNPWKRYWGLIVCSCFMKQAPDFVETAKGLAANDANFLVRTRAAEFLGLTGAQDPRPVLMDVLAKSDSDYETLLILNTVVLLKDGKPGYEFTIDPAKVKSKGGHVSGRLAYLTGKPMKSENKPAKRKKK